jgi:hypothetical protein
MQEFGQYDDWRIPKNMDVIGKAIGQHARPDQAKKTHQAPFDAYTLYYVGQALYQVGGEDWKRHYPPLRDSIVASQIDKPDDPAEHGMWRGRGRVSGRPGELYMTSVSCFILAIPNRYLPILQEGRIGSLQDRFKKD